MTPQERLALLQRLASLRIDKSSKDAKQARVILESLQQNPPKPLARNSNIIGINNPKLGYTGGHFNGDVYFENNRTGYESPKRALKPLRRLGVNTMLDQLNSTIPIGSRYQFMALYGADEMGEGRPYPKRASLYARQTNGAFDGRNAEGWGAGTRISETKWKPDNPAPVASSNPKHKSVVTYDTTKNLKRLIQIAGVPKFRPTAVGRGIGHPLVQGAMTIFDLVDMATDGGASKQAERMIKDPKAFFNYEALPKPATLIK